MLLKTLLLLFLAAICQSNKILDTSLQRIPKKSSLELDIWKYKGEKAQLHNVFKTVEFKVRLLNDGKNDADALYVYQSRNVSELLATFESGQKLLGFLQKWSFWRLTKLDPFVDTFVGVETTNEYDIRLNVKIIDFFLITLFLVGVFLFFGARKLSRNMAAFYVGGSMLGVLLSLLLLLFVLYRFIPNKRSVALLSMLSGAISLNCYLLYTMWCNMFMILKNYQRYVAIYTITVSLISLAICYKLGPPKDVKTRNVLQWSIQILGLIFVYNSCQIESVACFFISAMLLAYFCLDTFLKWSRIIRFKYFPAKSRFLTRDEYVRQGEVETKKALEDLRKYLRSPACDSWNLTSRLKSPRKLASFVSGDSHLSDEDLLNYDTCSPELDFTDDDDDDNSSSHSAIEEGPVMTRRPVISNGQLSSKMPTPAYKPKFDASTPKSTVSQTRLNVSGSSRLNQSLISSIHPRLIDDAEDWNSSSRPARFVRSTNFEKNRSFTAPTENRYYEWRGQ